MSTLTFDTFKYVEHLKSAGVSEEQARAGMEALAAALDETLVMRDLATKRDLDDLRRDMDSRFNQVDARLIQLEQRLIIKLGVMLGVAIALIAALVKLL